MSLRSIGAKVPADTLTTATCDISALLGEEEGTTILTWQEPDVPRLAAAAEGARAVKRRHPFWPDVLCLSVALLSASHVAPLDDGDSPGEFYAGIAEHNKRLWQFINSEWSRMFPSLADWEGGVAEAKKPSEDRSETPSP
jgi:hypothetical protein